MALGSIGCLEQSSGREGGQAAGASGARPTARVAELLLPRYRPSSQPRRSRGRSSAHASLRAPAAGSRRCSETFGPSRPVVRRRRCPRLLALAATAASASWQLMIALPAGAQALPRDPGDRRALVPRLPAGAARQVVPGEALDEARPPHLVARPGGRLVEPQRAVAPITFRRRARRGAGSPRRRRWPQPSSAGPAPAASVTSLAFHPRPAPSQSSRSPRRRGRSVASRAWRGFFAAQGQGARGIADGTSRNLGELASTGRYDTTGVILES